MIQLIIHCVFIYQTCIDLVNGLGLRLYKSFLSIIATFSSDAGFPQTTPAFNIGGLIDLSVSNNNLQTIYDEHLQSIDR